MSATRQVLKLVITGPVNAGKTTLVKHLCDAQFTGSDAPATDEVAKLKAFTTVGLDFGILKVDGTLELHLVGTPGQARFNFMWDILSRGAIGAVFLVDSTSADSLAEMRKMYDYFAKRVDLPAVVGATKQDLPGARAPDAIAEALGLGPEVPVLPVDAREPDQTRALVLTLLENALVAALAEEEEEGL